MPCGKIIRPAPKLFTSLPVESNFSTVGSSDILPVARSRQLFWPQRSATQIDLPSLSMSTALVDPHARPSGSLKKSATVVYGLGRSLVGATVLCASTVPPESRIRSARLFLDIAHQPVRTDFGAVD